MVSCALLAPENNALLRCVAEEIRCLTGERVPTLFLHELGNSSELVLDEQRLLLGGVDLASMDMVWLHRFRYENPILPKPLSYLDWSLWRVEYLIEQQRYSALSSLFAELERRGVNTLNGHREQLLGWMPQWQLESLQAAGSRVVSTLCTNVPERAKAFLEQHEQVVWRPTTGRAAWQRFGEKQRKDLIREDKPPALLAAVVPGAMLRGYVLQGRLVITLAHSTAGHYEGEESLEYFWLHKLSLAQEQQVVQAANRLGLSWGEVTFVVHEQSAVVYSIDFDPDIDSLPDRFRAYLVSVLAHELSGLDWKQVELPQQREARRALFTRRMMQVLFDFERIKYS